jgi:DNA-binding MarR family transcriptional regulator
MGLTYLLTLVRLRTIYNLIIRFLTNKVSEMENRELEIIIRFPKITHVILGKMIQGFQSSQTEMNLNQTQRRTLLILYDKGETTMTALHEAIGLEKGSLTTVIDQLIEKALVERKRDEKDRRKVYISVTPMGREKVGILRMEIASYIKNNLERLPSKDLERFYQAVEALTDISQKL